MPPEAGRQKKYFVGLENIRQLRKCIYKLAVSGQLTSRGQNTAYDDLGEILKSRKRLESEKEIKKYSLSNSEINNTEQNANIPENWEITRLGCITDISSGSTPLKGKPQYYENGGIPWVTSSATSEDFIYSSTVSISEVAVKECSLTLYKPGTLLMAMYGQGKTRGQVAELKISATINQACAAISFFDEHENIRPYVKLVLWKIYDEIRDLADGGAQPNLNGIKVKATLIPFPPLEEQKRIIAKVDQLMAICDQLEQQLTTAYGDAEKLIDATIKRLVA